MSYQSPIEQIVSDIQTSLENEVYKAVQRVGICVDRDELIKALKYDRDQYCKGVRDREALIVKCQECIHSIPSDFGEYRRCSRTDGYWTDDDYCSKGKRREE